VKRELWLDPEFLRRRAELAREGGRSGLHQARVPLDDGELATDGIRSP